MKRAATAFLLFALASAIGCGRTSEKRSEKETPSNSDAGSGTARNEVRLTQEAIDLAGLRIGKVERRALTGGAAIPGEVAFDPTSTAHVAPLVAGRITRVAVGLGDRVRNGQLLGTVASTDVSSARARLEQTQARLSAAERTLERQEALSKEGIGAQRALIDARAAVEELRAEVAGLRRQLSVFGSGSGGELALSSPVDGIVVEVHAALGETATPDRPMFTVTDPSKVWVQGEVPELEIPNVERGGAVLVRLHAFPEMTMPGTITYVAPSLNERMRSLPIRVSLTVPDPRLRSGLFAQVELVGSRADERVLALPVDAIANLDGQTVAFVPGKEASSFVAKPIAVGRRAGGFVEIRAGIEEGAPVVLNDAFMLKSALRSNELVGED